MEEKKISNTQLIINYGLLLGFLMVLTSVISYTMGYDGIREKDPYSTWVSLLFFIGVITYGIKQFKAQNNGFLSVGQGLKTGVGIVFIGSLISLAYTLIFMNFIEPDFAQRILEFSEEQMLEQGNLDDEQIEQALAITKNYFMPMLIAGIVLWSLFIGFAISLVASLVMQKKEFDDY